MEKEKDECALKRFLSKRQGYLGSLRWTGPVLLCSTAGGNYPTWTNFLKLFRVSTGRLWQFLGCRGCELACDRFTLKPF